MRNRQLDRIEALLQRLDAAVVVRDPGSARSVEAYDGLRKLIIQSGTSRRTHVSHLLSLADSVERGAPMDLIRDRVNDFLMELGISRSADVSLIEHFDLVEGEGQDVECITPAVIERFEDGRMNLVRRGTARRVLSETPQSSPVIVVESSARSEDSASGAIPDSPDRKAPQSRSLTASVTTALALICALLGLLVGTLI